jgi:hypothetical protein
VGKIEYTPVLFAYARSCPGLSQQASMCEAKVRANQKFFRNKNLPPPFNSRRFQLRAMSNAYLTAGSYAWSAELYHLFPKYLKKAVITDLTNLPHIFTEVSHLILLAPLLRLLPTKIKRMVKKRVFFPAKKVDLC